MNRRTRPGHMFLHSAVDGCSRLAYTEALPDEKAVTAIGFTFRVGAFFAAHGITRIERIVTDNGACYKARDFAKALLGARHQRITPYTPRHNGKVERYNRILAEEFLYAHEWISDLQRQQALQIWNIHYNYPFGHRKPAASQLPAYRRHERQDLIQLDDTAVKIRRGRVAVGSEIDETLPKSASIRMVDFPRRALSTLRPRLTWMFCSGIGCGVRGWFAGWLQSSDIDFLF